MSSRWPEAVHERARLLAAEAIDGDLQAADAQWLASHLADCAGCSGVAAEYASIRDELRALVLPEPPRDLWARTATALDNVDRAGRGRRGVPAVRRRLINLGLAAPSLLGTAAAVAIVVLIVGVSFFGQPPGTFGPRSSPSVASGPIAAGSPASPSAASTQQLIGVADGKSVWIQAGANGNYEIKGGIAACAGSSGPSCTIDGSSTTLGTILSSGEVSAAVDPNAQRAAVWNNDKIIVVPLTQTSPAAVSIDLATTPPAAASTTPPTPAPTPPVVTPSPTAPPATPTPPVSIASPTATPPAATTAPPASPSTIATGTAPVSGPSATPAALATPASPAPEGAILAGYEVLGTPQFSSDGTWLAFTARPVDHSTGPDVFVWRTGETAAQAVTQTHDAYLSAWSGVSLLVSRIDPSTAASGDPSQTATGAGSPSAWASPVWSYIIDPATGQAARIDRPMYRPVTDASGSFLVYWSGSVRIDPNTGLWEPDAGSLFFDRWSSLNVSPASLMGAAAASADPMDTSATSAPASASPTAEGPTQSSASSASATIPTASGSAAASSPSVLASPSLNPSLPQLLSASADPTSVRTWQIRWDASGSYLAIWVADLDSATAGRLSLFAVDRVNGEVNTDAPLLAAPATADFQFDGPQLVYTSTRAQGNGTTNVVLVPQLPAPPSQSPTPASSTPATTPGAGATDRPGR